MRSNCQFACTAFTLFASLAGRTSCSRNKICATPIAPLLCSMAQQNLLSLCCTEARTAPQC
jgi:hypothetical protein